MAQERDGGFNALLEIVNNGETIESNWQIEFDYDNELNDFWGGNIVFQGNNRYVVKPYRFGCSFNNGEVISSAFWLSSLLKELLY
ncbi:MAG: cellulose binding domain-containing protein [Lachnospiraceae bacterium]